MSAPFSTIYLDVGAWDLVLDTSGNIALAAPPYSLTQDVASACRTFFGEVYYDASIGVPYLGANPPTNEDNAFLGETPPLNLLQSALAAAALTVPAVAEAIAVISSFDVQGRVAMGQVQFTTDAGQQLEVAV